MIVILNKIHSFHRKRNSTERMFLSGINAHFNMFLYTMFTCYVNNRRHITLCDLYSLLHVTASVWVKRNERHQESGIEEKEDLHLRMRLGEAFLQKIRQ